MASYWWLLQKDLLTEYRARQSWPTMALLGGVVAMVFSLQAEGTDAVRQSLLGTMLWIATFFAAMTGLDRAFALERQDGCWDGLRSYPVHSTTVFLAKFTSHVLALGLLQALLTPLFIVLCHVAWHAPWWATLLVAALGNFGIAAVGTLVGALTSGMKHGGGMLVVVVLPLSVPVLLAAAEATRLMSAGQCDAAWWRWINLLAAFAIIYLTAGAALFEFVVED